MVVESRCVVLDLVAFIFKGCGCIPGRGIVELLERDMSNVERAGSSTKLTVSSS
jgi:hypothetical protein